MSDNDSARVPGITSRDQLAPEDREHFDSIDESRGGVRGPFRLLLHSPEVAGRTGHLGAYIRFESHLQGPERELAILTTAREFDCAYEWAVHAPIARDEGVREEAIAVVAEREPVTGLTDTESAIVQYGRQLFREHRISEETYNSAAEQFDDQRLVELTATFGYYAMLASVLNAFELLPAEESPGFP